jgi:hypothetical protein
MFHLAPLPDCQPGKRRTKKGAQDEGGRGRQAALKPNCMETIHITSEHRLTARPRCFTVADCFTEAVALTLIMVKLKFPTRGCRST